MSDTPVTALLREALAEDAPLLHHFVHPDVPFEECDGARCVRRRTLLASSDGSGEPYQDDIIQAATGGPDFTVKEWPEDDVAGSGERRSCDPREHGGKHAPWCHAATPTRLSSSIDDASTQAPRGETPEA